ncbi:hypothetical protein, partial [Rhodosalinus sp.]|uniref:hypothetical protein n=1 Tax=Rhodosalinus sp. TaxID=2047741 RepID=UPI00397D0182
GGAQLQGAFLGGVEMDDITALDEATLRGASARAVDDVAITRLQPHWHEIFADGSVSVPEAERPAHWPREVLPGYDFRDAWRAWRRSIGMDPDDPK